jgi:hypothetical protein
MHDVVQYFRLIGLPILLHAAGYTDNMMHGVCVCVCVCMEPHEQGRLYLAI